MNLDTPPSAIPAHVPAELVFDFDIYADPRLTDDVQGSYAEALKDAPDVFYTPRNGGHWIVRRFAPTQALFQDYEHFSAREMHIPRIPDHPVFLPLSYDPPHSIPFRQAMMPAFSPRAVRALEPQMRGWAIRLVEAVADAGSCDFVDEIAALFPVSVFMEIMGMPLTRLREFRELTATFFRSHDQPAVDRTRGEILGILSELIEARRRAPGEDLVSWLLASDIGGRPPSQDEMLAMCFLLFLGGMDTVTNVTGFAFRRLGQDPALQRRLAADANLIPQFVEEALRCFSVVNPSRLVIKDCDVLGPQLKAGEMVIAIASEAGRDARRNPDPHRFDIDRKDGAHLTFTTGPHLCIGHILARAEMRILTEEWLRLIPAFGLRADARRGFRFGVICALEDLPLEWPVGSRPAA